MDDSQKIDFCWGRVVVNMYAIFILSYNISIQIHILQYSTV